MQQFVSFAESHREWLMTTIEALVCLESPSTDKGAVDACGAELSRRLTAAGAQVERVPCATRGDHIRARFAADGPQITLLGHFDTVWPLGRLQQMPYREENGRLYGPGVFDMKAGIAVGMLATRAVRELTSHPPSIVMLWTTDEEVGSGRVARSSSSSHRCPAAP
jgi:glutamate carboxypeptidase